MPQKRMISTQNVPDINKQCFMHDNEIYSLKGY